MRLLLFISLLFGVDSHERHIAQDYCKLKQEITVVQPCQISLFFSRERYDRAVEGALRAARIRRHRQLWRLTSPWIGARRYG